MIKSQKNSFTNDYSLSTGREQHPRKEGFKVCPVQAKELVADELKDNTTARRFLLALEDKKTIIAPSRKVGTSKELCA
jgi:hypothetical protein